MIKFPDGSSYEGAFENDCFSGFGVYTYENGAKYYGNRNYTYRVSGRVIKKREKPK